MPYINKVCSVGMSDLATPATSFVQKEHPAYHQAKNVYTQDLEKAKALFAETGLKSVRLLASDHDFFAAPIAWQQRLWPTEEFELARSRVPVRLPEEDLFAGIEVDG